MALAAGRADALSAPIVLVSGLLNGKIYLRPLYSYFSSLGHTAEDLSA